MNNKQNDTSINSEWSDPVFDSLLEEAVSGRRPPDLRARIANAWRQEQAGRIPLPSPSVVGAIGAAGELIAPPVVEQQARAAKSNAWRATVGATSGPAGLSSEPNTKRPSYAWQVLLVIAASGVLIACAVQWRSAFAPAENAIAGVTKKATNTNLGPQDGRANTVASSSPPVSPAVRTANDDSSKANLAGGENEKNEKLALENVPFANRNTNVAESPRLNAKKPALPGLNDQQIVELIDTQLATLWQRMKVVPAAKMDEMRLVQLLSKTLAGQDLPAAFMAELVDFKPAERRERVIAQAMDSQAFARRWAAEITSQWTRGGGLARDSAPVQRLEEFLSSGIAGARPWNEVVTQALAGQSTAGDVLISSLAGRGNHRLVTRLSGSFLDSSLACVRCHEAKNSGSDAKSQDQYWSMVALLIGLDVRTTEVPDERSAVDMQAKLFAAEQQPSLFFERPDGTLEAAKFILPDGQPWQSIAGASSPRAALASWIGNSAQADEAVVNQVWQVVFGRPLVATNAILDDVGAAERTELQQLLAQQFRANGRRLPQLIGWIVRSDAFARDAIMVDQNRWLQAPDSDIENWHLAEMTFAARTSLGQQAVKGGLENALAAATRWNQTIGSGSSSVQGNGPIVLAQPSVDSKVKSKTPVKTDIVMPAVGYAIHRGRLSSEQRTYISRLVASDKLTWEQKVEHIVSLSPNQSAGSNVKRISDELLKSLNDPSAVLTELLWAVQNADAS